MVTNVQKSNSILLRSDSICCKVQYGRVINGFNMSACFQAACTSAVCTWIEHDDDVNISTAILNHSWAGTKQKQDASYKLPAGDAALNRHWCG